MTSPLAKRTRSETDASPLAREPPPVYLLITIVRPNGEDSAFRVPYESKSVPVVLAAIDACAKAERDRYKPEISTEFALAFEAAIGRSVNEMDRFRDGRIRIATAPGFYRRRWYYEIEDDDDVLAFDLSALIADRDRWEVYHEDRTYPATALYHPVEIQAWCDYDNDGDYPPDDDN